MSLELSKATLTGAQALNAVVLKTEKQIADIRAEQKSSVLHSLAFKLCTLGVGFAVSFFLSLYEKKQINQLKQGVLDLHRKLDDAVCKMKDGQFQEHGFQVQMVDETVHFRVEVTGQIFIRMADEPEDKEYELDASVEDLRYKLAEDIFKHPDIFGREELIKVLPRRDGSERTRQQTSIENSYERRVFELAIESRSNIRGDRLQNVTTANLGELAYDALLNYDSVDEVTEDLDGILKHLDQLISSDHLTSVEADALVSAFEEQAKADEEKATEGEENAKSVTSSIVVSGMKEKESPEPSKSGEVVKIPQSYRDLLADFFTVEFKKTDSDEQIIATFRSVLCRNSGALTDMIHNTGALLRLISSLRSGPSSNKLFHEALSNVYKSVVGLKQLFTNLNSKCTEADVKACLNRALGDAESRKALRDELQKRPSLLFKIEECYDGLLAGVVAGGKLVGEVPGQVMNDVSATIEAKMNQIFKSDSEIPKWENATTINQMLANAKAASGKSGYMSFVKTVLTNYFKEVPAQDQRAMVVAALRYGHDGDTELEMFGAMLKGAGPLLQKMLQGLDESNFGKDFIPIFQDMKQHLAPVDHQQIQAYLLDVKNRSGGKIEKIEAKKNLGAASVGEVVDCDLKIKGSDTPKSVAVKVLRPDALNRIGREKDLMLKYAEQCGIKDAYETQVKTVMGEFDLTEEAENIRKGQIYNKGSKRVRSVKTDNIVAATPTTLVMEKAPGRTVEDVIKDTREQIAILKELAATNPKEAETKLKTLYAELETMHNDLCIFAKQWLTEGLFGSGFTHGDLHGANILLDPKKGLTVLDWGNAVQLTADQKDKITSVMAAAYTGEQAVDYFIDGFKGLLTEKALATFNDKEPEIRELVTKVLSAGGKRDTGSRIFIILTKLQEMGVETPGPIFAFSQSETRLESALDRLAKEMNNLREALFSFPKISYDKSTQQQQSYGAVAKRFAVDVEFGLKNVNKGYTQKVDSTFEIISHLFEGESAATMRKNLLSYLTDTGEGGEKENRLIFKSIGQFKEMGVEGIEELEQDYNEYFAVRGQSAKEPDQILEDAFNPSFKKKVENSRLTLTALPEWEGKFLDWVIYSKAYEEFESDVKRFASENEGKKIDKEGFVNYLKNEMNAVEAKPESEVAGSVEYFKSKIYHFLLDGEGKRFLEDAGDSFVSKWNLVVNAKDKAEQLPEKIVNAFIEADKTCLGLLYDESKAMVKDFSENQPHTFVDCVTDVLGQHRASVLRRTGTGLANLARKV